MSCTPGVRLADRSQMFTRRWSTMCSEQHFLTPPVRICTAPRSRTRTAHLRYLYTTCTKQGCPVGPCTTGVQLPDRSRMFTRQWSTMCSKWHFRTPPVRISTAPRSRTGTAPLGFVYTTCTKLGSPIEPCITGVRLQDRSGMFTRPWKTICSDRQFRTALVRICTSPRGRTPKAQLGCVCTNYKKLVGPVVPFTSGIRVPDCSQMFNRRGKTICSKCHFRTPPVWICTAPLSRTGTAHLDYMCTQPVPNWEVP